MRLGKLNYRKYPGAKIGSYVSDGDSIGIYLGVCPGCKHRLLVNRKEAEQLSRRYYKSAKRFRNRMIAQLLKRLDRDSDQLSLF